MPCRCNTTHRIWANDSPAINSNKLQLSKHRRTADALHNNSMQQQPWSPNMAWQGVLREKRWQNLSNGRPTMFVLERQNILENLKPVTFLLVFRLKQWNTIPHIQIPSMTEKLLVNSKFATRKGVNYGFLGLVFYIQWKGRMQVCLLRSNCLQMAARIWFEAVKGE